MGKISKNTLFYGDNLDILRQYIDDESVDLIYLDPPFNSNRSYNVLFKDESGYDSKAQITAFDDTWHWGETAEETYYELVNNSFPEIASMIGALRQFIGTNQMMAYLVMMTPRLIELKRVLKDTGSIFLHCDPTASHYLKVLMDVIFGNENYVNEIIWRRYKRPKGSQFESRKFGDSTDTILFYSKSDKYNFFIDRVYIELDEESISKRYTHQDEKSLYYSGPLLRSKSMGPRPNLVYEYKGFTPGPEGWRMTIDKLEKLDKEGDFFWTENGTPRRKVRPNGMPITHVDNLWIDIEAIGSQANERLGYPTQKPEELLERIIKISSNENDIVLDPFSGCGTAIAISQKLNRKWIGIDITYLAIALHKNRLKDMFGLEPKINYDIYGEPQSLHDAKQLANDNRFQFEWWALSLIEARPAGDKKKGSDKGIDGIITFTDDSKREVKQVLVQVKSGHVNSGLIRDFRGTIEREPNAVLGIFITLENPSRDMENEALEAGYYISPFTGQKHKKIQIITIEDLLDDKNPDLPISASFSTFKKAEKVENKKKGFQEKFDL